MVVFREVEYYSRVGSKGYQYENMQQGIEQNEKENLLKLFVWNHVVLRSSYLDAANSRAR